MPLNLRKFAPAFLLASLGSLAATSANAPGALRIAAFHRLWPQHRASKKEPPKEVSKDLPMPFSAGETLTYRVLWTVFSNAASVELSVPERRDLFGWSTWHFRAVAHTLNPVRTIFTIDDEFDSFTDAATLESRRFEMYLDEMGQKQERTLHPVPQGQSPRGGVSAIVVLPGTRDPLGALYSLRCVDWARTPELRAPVFDGRNLYDMRARLEKPDDSVTLAAGARLASRISIRVFQSNKEVAGASFVVWLAHDAARTPLLMQAEIPFGAFRVELTSPVK